MLGAISVLTGQQLPTGGQHGVSTYSWWSQVSRAASDLLLICFEITLFLFIVCARVYTYMPQSVWGGQGTSCDTYLFSPVLEFLKLILCVCMIYVCTCGCKGIMAHMWRSEDSLGWWSSSCLVWGRVSFLHCCCVLHANWPESFQRSLCLHLPLPWGSAGTTGTTRRTNPVLHGLWVSELRSLILGPLPTRSFSQPCFLSFKIIML